MLKIGVPCPREQLNDLAAMDVKTKISSLSEIEDMICKFLSRADDDLLDKVYALGRSHLI